MRCLLAAEVEAEAVAARLGHPLTSERRGQLVVGEIGVPGSRDGHLIVHVAFDAQALPGVRLLPQMQTRYVPITD